jgi:hypothetical protein
MFLVGSFYSPEAGRTKIAKATVLTSDPEKEEEALAALCIAQGPFYVRALWPSFYCCLPVPLWLTSGTLIKPWLSSSHRELHYI